MRKNKILSYLIKWARATFKKQTQMPVDRKCKHNVEAKQITKDNLVAYRVKVRYAAIEVFTETWDEFIRKMEEWLAWLAEEGIYYESSAISQRTNSDGKRLYFIHDTDEPSRYVEVPPKLMQTVRDIFKDNIRDIFKDNI